MSVIAHDESLAARSCELRFDALAADWFPCIMRTQGAALARADTQALAPAVYCTGRRPDAAGGWARAYEGGTSAQRKGCCCWVPVK